MKYKKKPVVVDAIQWRPFEMLIYDVLKFMGLTTGKMSDQGILSVGKYKGELIIKTREGDMTVMDGDWIIKEPFPTNDRKFYPCKPDIFEQTYEPVPDESQAYGNDCPVGKCES